MTIEAYALSSFVVLAFTPARAKHRVHVLQFRDVITLSDDKVPASNTQFSRCTANRADKCISTLGSRVTYTRTPLNEAKHEHANDDSHIDVWVRCTTSSNHVTMLMMDRLTMSREIIIERHFIQLTHRVAANLNSKIDIFRSFVFLFFIIFSCVALASNGATQFA